MGPDAVILEGLGAGLSVAACSLLSEDAALLGAAELAGAGRLDWSLAFAFAAAGIILGDLGLYALGFWLGPRIPGLPWLGRRLTPERLARGRAWIEKAGFLGVLVSRCVPGSRLTGYTAAGIFRVPFPPFAAAVLVSGLLWVGGILAMARLLGRTAGWRAAWLALAGGLILGRWAYGWWKGARSAPTATT